MQTVVGLVIFGLGAAFFGALACIYFFTWLLLGFGVGLYLSLMTFTAPVRISSSAGSAAFQIGFAIFPFLNDVITFLAENVIFVGGAALAAVTPRAPEEVAETQVPYQTSSMFKHKASNSQISPEC